MVLFFTLALWAGWELLGNPSTSGMRRFAWWATFAVALGLGFLAKGPIAWIVIVPVIALAVRTTRGGPRFWIGLPLVFLAAAGVVWLWAGPALALTDGKFFEVGIGKHVVRRSFTAFEGHGARNLLGYIAMLPFFFLTIFPSFFPGSIWLPWLVKRLRFRENRTDGTFYLATAAATVVIVFTVVSTKLPHYILPAFPALAILLAGEWFRAGRESATLRKWSAGTAVFALALSLVGFPFAARFFVTPRLAKESTHLLRPEMEFCSVAYEEPSLVWYFRKHVEGFHRKRKIHQVGDYMDRKGPRFCIVPTDKVDEIEHPDINRWERVRVTGINVAKGKPVDLTLMVKDSNP